MQVEMRTRIGGYRNGVEWPDVGGVIDVPEDEAISLIENRYAKPCEWESDAEPNAEPAVPSGDPDSGDGSEPTAAEPDTGADPSVSDTDGSEGEPPAAAEPVSELTRQQKAALTRAANKAAAAAG